MKKITLFMAGMLFAGVTATFAQADTTGRSSQTPTQSHPDRQQSDRQSDQNRNYTKDMVKIQSTEVPDNLRQTLSGTQYKGWESGTVYRTKNSDGYLLEMKDGSRTKVYRFDANGKPQGQ